MTLKTKAQFKELGYVSITELAELAGRIVHGGFRDTAKLSGVREIPVTDDNGKTEFLYCAADASKIPPVKRRGSYKKKEAPEPLPAPEEIPTPFDDEPPAPIIADPLGHAIDMLSLKVDTLVLMIDAEKKRINAFTERIVSLEQAPIPGNGKQPRLFPEEQRIIDALERRIISVENGEDGILERIEKLEESMKILQEFRAEFYPPQVEGK